MENLTYTKDQIEELLNLMNTLPFHGFESANKMARVFQILNCPIPNEQINEPKEAKEIKEAINLSKN